MAHQYHLHQMMQNHHRKRKDGASQLTSHLEEAKRNLAARKSPPPVTDLQLLKAALADPPILRLPKAGLPFSVDTDACEYQVGCALFQTYPDGSRHPVGFWSRSLNDAERNYSVGEKECLAIVWAVQILRPYLERKHFDLYTDHQSLKWMMSLTDVSGRLARWRLRLL